MGQPFLDSRGTLRAWMKRVVSTGNSLEDLHVNVASAEYHASESWLEGSLAMFEYATIVRDADFPTYVVAIGFTLHDSANKAPPVVMTGEALQAEMDAIQPPSVYLFSEDDSPIADDPDVTNVGLVAEEGLTWPKAKAYYRVWRESGESLYRRSFFIVG